MARTIGALLALWLPLSAWAQLPAGEVEIVREAGPAESRIDLVIVAEGYTEEDRQQFSEDVERMVEGMFSYAPWSDYAGLFNVTGLFFPSNERGADLGTYGQERDTVFGATFGCAGLDRLLCVDIWLVLQAAATHAPEFDVVVVLVNDPKYGGAGGGVAVASLNQLAIEVVVHELAHTLPRLADEYESPYPGYPGCDPFADCGEPNVTLRTEREELKWGVWVDPDMPIPSSPGQAGVGLFEGARYQSWGVYRPEHDCMMRSYDRSDFCAVCTEAHVLSFLETTGLIMDAFPVEPLPFAGCEEEHVLRVETTLPPDQLIFTWEVDGRTRTTETGELILQGWELPEGEGVVTVRVEHSTPLVRSDPDEVLVEERTFDVRGEDCTQVCLQIECDESGCVRRPEENGTPCGASSCGAGVVQGMACLDGACEAYERACAPYACAAEGGCLEGCASDADCAEGYECREGACLEPAPPPGPGPGAIETSPSGCGCSGGGGGPGALWGVALSLLLLRRFTAGRKIV